MFHSALSSLWALSAGQICLLEEKVSLDCKGKACVTAGHSHLIALKAVTELIMVSSLKKKILP